MRFWRTAYASVVGTSHARTGAPCQDAGCCRLVKAHDGRDILLAAVADGAGSAKRSEAGAAIAVDMFLEEFGEAVATDPHLHGLDQEFVIDWLDSARDCISARAAAEGLEPRDFACTFLAAVVGPSDFVCFQIGDGAIVVSDQEIGAYSCVFWPQHGEFANTTNFITQDRVEEVLMFERSERVIQEIALFSDGIERLVLDLSAKSVHAPSLQPIFGWLAGTEPAAPNGPAAALVAYLGSEHVNRRTDDDKTLVMATRAALLQEQPPAGA